MENKKHILFISSWYPNRQDSTHGIFNRFFAEAASLYNKVSVLHVCSEENLKSNFECVESYENNIRTVTVYYKKIASRFPLFSQLKKKRKVLEAFDMGYDLLIKKEGKVDLIQINVIMQMGIGAYHLSQKHKIPYVINENWSGYCEEDGSYKGFTKQFYTRKIVKHAKAIMPTSTYLKEAMLSHNLNGNYVVVPNVVNVNIFKPEAKEQNKITRLIHISSLNDREKNVSGLIRAFGKAVEKNTSLELNIVGEGVDKEKYKKLVNKLTLENKINFKGRIISKDLVYEINANDALIMFSNYETFCLVIIEAFACAKPVITSNAGAIKTYMKPELGIMVEKQNEEQLTHAILDFSENKEKYDRNFIRQFAVDNYSYEKVGEKLDRIYNLALRTNKQSSTNSNTSN
ncbi:glycosyltransferase [Aurantibacillus circumpalustris]|uniref:glycosyltransferase n=1 Tax=Aurantibacillus circumpalustris TaxID=3036359 RepID=UPI00295A61F5|nr:glycosyltransferase [Aurantibacillus circumpalustris]